MENKILDDLSEFEESILTDDELIHVMKARSFCEACTAEIQKLQARVNELQAASEYKSVEMFHGLYRNRELPMTTNGMLHISDTKQVTLLYNYLDIDFIDVDKEVKTKIVYN